MRSTSFSRARMDLFLAAMFSWRGCDDEADSKSGLISYNSPIARALIGKVEGDVVSVAAPGGQREFEIMAVEYV